MTIKMIGAIFIIAGCAGMGFSIAATHKRAEYALQQLLLATEWMSCELEHHLSALPDLCREAASQTRGSMHSVLLHLAAEMEKQQYCDARACMTIALEKEKDLPETARKHLQRMGQSLGRFDLPGQLSGLASVRQTVKRDLDGLRSNMDIRLRSYRTLGICAGAALAILFI